MQALGNPWTAELLERLHPMRTRRYLFSEAFNPWMHGIALLANAIAERRQALPQDHPWIGRERAAIGEITQAPEKPRKTRDAAYERGFDLLYGNAGNRSAESG
jgi:hypothetical protein